MGATGATGAVGPTGPTGPTGTAVLTAFGSVYTLADGDTITVAPGESVLFTANGVLAGVTHTPGAAAVIPAQTGTYLIEYAVYADGSIVLTRNGVPEPGTALTGGPLTGTTVLSAEAGDTLEIRNAGEADLTLPPSPAAGAQMTLVRLS